MSMNRVIEILTLIIELEGLGERMDAFLAAHAAAYRAMARMRTNDVSPDVVTLKMLNSLLDFATTAKEVAESNQTMPRNTSVNVNMRHLLDRPEKPLVQTVISEPVDLSTAMHESPLSTSIFTRKALRDEDQTKYINPGHQSFFTKAAIRKVDVSTPPLPFTEKSFFTTTPVRDLDLSAIVGVTDETFNALIYGRADDDTIRQTLKLPDVVEDPYVCLQVLYWLDMFYRNCVERSVPQVTAIRHGNLTLAGFQQMLDGKFESSTTIHFLRLLASAKTFRDIWEFFKRVYEQTGSDNKELASVAESIEAELDIPLGRNRTWNADNAML